MTIKSLVFTVLSRFGFASNYFPYFIAKYYMLVVNSSPVEGTTTTCPFWGSLSIRCIELVLLLVYRCGKEIGYQVICTRINILCPILTETLAFGISVFQQIYKGKYDEVENNQ